MPSAPELLGLVIVIFFIWLILKVARVAIRFVFLVIAVTVILGALYWLFMR